MKYSKFANMLFARIQFPFKIEDVYHIDCSDIGTTFIQLKNRDVYVLSVKSLEEEEANCEFVEVVRRLIEKF